MEGRPQHNEVVDLRLRHMAAQGDEADRGVWGRRRQANVALPKELAHAMPTLRTIMRNGSDRSLSIRELAAERGITFTAARKKYFADRKKLMNLFAP